MNNLYPSPANILPHSYPFVMIDRILELEGGKRIVCLKNVTINEKFFQGHFRDNHIMPGVLILEAMAQASGLIICRDKMRAYLTAVKDAKLKKSVIPGDQLLIKSSLIKSFPPLYVFDVVASVENTEIAEAEIILTTI